MLGDTAAHGEVGRERETRTETRQGGGHAPPWHGTRGAINSGRRLASEAAAHLVLVLGKVPRDHRQVERPEDRLLRFPREEELERSANELFTRYPAVRELAVVVIVDRHDVRRSGPGLGHEDVVLAFPPWLDDDFR